MVRMLGWSRTNWFYVLLPLLLAAAFSMRPDLPWTSRPQLAEGAVLFDWCLFVPLLFLVCYRGMPRRALVIRTFAMVCGGLWIAGKLVPHSAQTILHGLSWVRPVGIAVTLSFEALAVVAILRVLFGAVPDPTELERQGIPPLLARIMLLEARFWRWVWVSLRGR